MKRDHLRLDGDNVCKEYVSSGKELLTIPIEQRVRFLDIIASSLNCRRALRQIVLPRLERIEKELSGIRNALGSTQRAQPARNTRPRKNPGNR